MNHFAGEEEKIFLEEKYRGRKAYHGELHDHSATGGTSDGRYNLAEWRGFLAELEMDFAALLDHRQVRHMYLPEWDDTIFIGGSEASATMRWLDLPKRSIHFNMVFSDPEGLVRVLKEFPEMEFSGGIEGHFNYKSFEKERFFDLVEVIKREGGAFVHAHPKQTMRSENPLDYWFGDETGLEVFYLDMANDYTKANYKLWCDLLALGKRVWATAGHDGHRMTRDTALSTIYAEEKKASHFVRHLRVGDLTCGGMGIRMVLGEALTGGVAPFGRDRLIVSVGDFHRTIRKKDPRYELRLIGSRGEILREEILCGETQYFSFATDPEEAFYRVEIHDPHREASLIGIGNPIWNEKKE